MIKKGDYILITDKSDSFYLKIGEVIGKESDFDEFSNIYIVRFMHDIETNIEKIKQYSSDLIIKCKVLLTETNVNILKRINYITITFFNPGDTSNMEVEIDENLTPEEIIRECILCGFINDCKAGYRLFNKRMMTELPNSVSVSELGIKNGDDIRIIYNTDAGGGFGGLWEIIYPYLDAIGTILGIVELGIEFGKWLKKKFEYYYAPKNFMSFITECDSWSSNELASKLNIKKDEAKHLLKGFGYEWDNEKLLYCSTKRTKAIVNLVDEAMKK